MQVVEVVEVVEVAYMPDFHYLGEKLSIQPFSIWNNLSAHTLYREPSIRSFSCSPFYIIYNKMDKVFREGDLTPIRHREFNEFIKGKGFKGRNNYKLRDLRPCLDLNLCLLDLQ